MNVFACCADFCKVIEIDSDSDYDMDDAGRIGRPACFSPQEAREAVNVRVLCDTA